MFGIILVPVPALVPFKLCLNELLSYIFYKTFLLLVLPSDIEESVQ